MYSSFGRIPDEMMAYLVSLISPMQMLYSHLNSITYIVILKDFQDFLIGVYRKLFFRRNEKQSQVNRLKSATSNGENWEKGKCNRIKKLITNYSLFLIGLMLLGNTLVALVSFSSLSSDAVRRFEQASQIQARQFKTKKNMESNLRAQTHNQNDDDIKTFCARNNGVFRFALRRCFFVLEHMSPGLNFSEHVHNCEERGAVLTYPRTPGEIETKWDLFRDFLENNGASLNLNFLRFVNLHLGFERYTVDGGLFGGYLFRSVDEKLIISTNTHGSFRNNGRAHAFFRFSRPFEASAVCINQAKVVSNCLPKNHKRYSVCSCDFWNIHAVSAHFS